MRLISTYDAPIFGAPLLYDLLKERDDTINISHRKMPSYLEHQKFIASRPYEAWYLIEVDDDCVGAIYLTRHDEIGVFILKEHWGRGHAKRAIRELMVLHPRERYIANINPRNARSIELFHALGFTHIQNTYELRP